MKKTLLSLIIVLVIGFSVQAQSLVIKDKTGAVVTGQTIDEFCIPGAGMHAIGLDVYNVSDLRKNVMVRKIEHSLIADSEVYFCWASCYPSFVFESPEPILVEAGAFSTNFTGDVSYGSTQGTISATFVFFDMDNAVDSSFVTINFIVGTLGIPVNKVALSSLSNAYPNPASSASYVDYKLPKSAVGASLRINSLLGVTIQDIPLDRSEGKATIDVSKLKEGIYFYSLIVNNSITQTRKFVVKR